MAAAVSKDCVGAKTTVLAHPKHRLQHLGGGRQLLIRRGLHCSKLESSGARDEERCLTHEHDVNGEAETGTQVED